MEWEGHQGFTESLCGCPRPGQSRPLLLPALLAPPRRPPSRKSPGGLGVRKPLRSAPGPAAAQRCSGPHREDRDRSAARGADAAPNDEESLPSEAKWGFSESQAQGSPSPGSDANGRQKKLKTL